MTTVMKGTAGICKEADTQILHVQWQKVHVSCMGGCPLLTGQEDEEIAVEIIVTDRRAN